MSEKPFTDHDLAKLLLRLAVGGLMLFHGVDKVHHGVDSIRGMLSGAGLPEWLAWGVYVGEVLAPILIVVGVFTRPAGLVVAFTMVMATYLASRDDLFALKEHGGLAIELSLLYLVGALALFLTGGGRYALRKGQGQWD